MKRLIAAALVLAWVSFLASQVYARGGKTPSVTYTSRNDGSSNNQFAITCSSFAWTSIGSTSYVASGTGPSLRRRRALTIQTVGTVNYGVCLSSTTNALDTCTDSRPGYELGTAWASVSIYDEAVWYCQTRSGGPTAIKGVEHYESTDEAK